jgi:hypothetical protein
MVRKTREGGASGKPALRPLVLLVDADGLRRSRLARALVTEGFDVRITLGEFDDSERPRLAIVHVEKESAGGSGILRALVDGYPRVPIMLRAAHPAAAEAQAQQLGLQVVQAFPSNESFKEIIARAKEMVIGTAHTIPPPPPTLPSPGGDSSSERLKPEALRRVPMLLVSREDVGWFDGDPQEGALLALIDGRSDLYALAVRCGVDEATALRLADALVARGLVALEEPIN